MQGHDIEKCRHALDTDPIGDSVDELTALIRFKWINYHTEASFKNRQGMLVWLELTDVN